MQDDDHTGSSRAGPTRTAILDAFATLAAARRYDSIRVADLIAAAGVGRSTFYNHFRGKNDVLLAAMAPILLALATAASGRAARSYVRQTVEHLWARRSVTRVLFGPAAAPLLQRQLAAGIRSHVERITGDTQGGAAITATGIAAAQIAMLRSWLVGEESATVDTMTDRLIACSRLAAN